MIIKHGRHIFWEVHEVRKGLWAVFLDCAFWMLIGWAGKLRSHGSNVIIGHTKQKLCEARGHFLCMATVSVLTASLLSIPRSGQWSMLCTNLNNVEKLMTILRPDTPGERPWSKLYAKKNLKRRRKSPALNIVVELSTFLQYVPLGQNRSMIKRIGDFRVAFRLCFKASPSAKPFIWKLVLFTCKWTKICVWIKLISMWKASH